MCSETNKNLIIKILTNLLTKIIDSKMFRCKSLYKNNFLRNEKTFIYTKNNEKQNLTIFCAKFKLL